ncbi:flagellar assembly protein FliH [Thalassotalea insulae]|uniref:Flagellar assembly protein FliH n=1 Tax=Thalassotalea insulae TaxID=2056778 RepID=A0ABQ6GP07_9GAMM|nr:flagellar assembly protein FliH [Thalassotalea insulae]GLX77621.1 flagellar assembly protein FliH [Thalassotalea insulae]
MKNFNSVNQTDKIVKVAEQDELDVWSLPSVEQEIDESDVATNALGKKPTWRYEPPEEVEEEIVPLTADEIEQIRQAAYDEGFNQGKEEGFATGFDEGKKSGHEEGVKLGHQEGVEAGLAEGQATIEQLAQQWQTLTEQLHQPLAQVEQNIEQQLLHLVVQLTEAITLEEAKTNPAILISAISAGMKALPSHDVQTQILLHPEDIKLVEQQFTSEYVEEQGWRLMAAPQLDRGSCQIENSTSNIDLSIKSRIREVLDSFLQDALHQ